MAGGPGGHIPDFAVIEKRTEAEIGNLLILSPPQIFGVLYSPAYYSENFLNFAK